MHLLIDLLALVDIIPHVRKRCFCLRMRLPGEWLREQEPVSSLELKVRQSFVVCASHVSIDLDETRNQIARAVRIKLADDLLHKRIAHLQVVNGVFGLLFLWELEVYRGGHVIPRTVRSEDLWNGVGGYIPCK